MKNPWILAVAEENQAEQEGLTGVPIDSEQQTTEQITTTDANGAGKPAAKPNTLMQFLPLILIFIIIYLFMFRGPRKKQQEHAKMVQALEKNDKVRTIGGIYGTVVDIKDDEITLKIDEANNTKIHVSRSAIGTKVNV